MAPHSQRNQQSKSERQVNISDNECFQKIRLKPDFPETRGIFFFKFSSINSDFKTIDGKTTTRKNQQIIE